MTSTLKICTYLLCRHFLFGIYRRLLSCYPHGAAVAHRASCISYCGSLGRLFDAIGSMSQLARLLRPTLLPWVP